MARRQAARPKTLTGSERAAVLALGDDLGRACNAPTTADKDRKHQLLRTLIDEVNITLHRDDPGPHADLDRRRDQRADPATSKHPPRTEARLLDRIKGSYRHLRDRVTGQRAR